MSGRAHRIFYTFQGDIEFQESENASLLVHISARDEETGRVKVEYNLLDGGTIVDIQVVSLRIYMNFN